MYNWDEIRTAAEVVRLGTISGAAEALGVHRATVNRHIDTVESALGAKLFLRHARGFTPTELGLDLLRVADITDDQFNQLQRRAKRQSSLLSGELIITAVDVMAEDLLPVVKVFKDTHPNVTVHIVASENILKLEYGEAHIALRPGKRPRNPDNVVIPFKKMRMGLYASQSYIDTHGYPKSSADFDDHYFIGPSSENPKASMLMWMKNNIPEASITLRSDQMPVLNKAILGGLGIGFLPQSLAKSRPDIVEIMKPRAEWVVGTWIVTHVDLHRTAKVQAFLDIIKTTISKDV